MRGQMSRKERRRRARPRRSLRIVECTFAVAAVALSAVVAVGGHDPCNRVRLTRPSGTSGHLTTSRSPASTPIHKRY